MYIYNSLSYSTESALPATASWWAADRYFLHCHTATHNKGWNYRIGPFLEGIKFRRFAKNVNQISLPLSRCSLTTPTMQFAVFIFEDGPKIRENCFPRKKDLYNVWYGYYMSILFPPPHTPLSHVHNLYYSTYLLLPQLSFFLVKLGLMSRSWCVWGVF